MYSATFCCGFWTGKEFPSSMHSSAHSVILPRCFLSPSLGKLEGTSKSMQALVLESDAWGQAVVADFDGDADMGHFQSLAFHSNSAKQAYAHRWVNNDPVPFNDFGHRPIPRHAPLPLMGLIFRFNARQETIEADLAAQRANNKYQNPRARQCEELGSGCTSLFQVHHDEVSSLLSPLLTVHASCTELCFYIDAALLPYCFCHCLHSPFG